MFLKYLSCLWDLRQQTKISPRTAKIILINVSLTPAQLLKCVEMIHKWCHSDNTKAFHWQTQVLYLGWLCLQHIFKWRQHDTGCHHWLETEQAKISGERQINMIHRSLYISKLCIICIPCSNWVVYYYY